MNNQRPCFHFHVTLPSLGMKYVKSELGRLCMPAVSDFLGASLNVLR